MRPPWDNAKVVGLTSMVGISDFFYLSNGYLINVNEGDALKWDDSDNEEDERVERKKKVKRGKRSAKQI